MRRVWRALGLCLAVFAAAPAAANPAAVAEAVMGLGRDTRWTQVSVTPIGFDAFHAQGLVKVGDVFFVTAVEILERTTFYPEPRDGFDRSQGRGQGWLFKMNAKGELLAKIKLGEGAVYHAGGLDFDGKRLWVPVAEYRPGGQSILYSVDPATLKVTEQLRVDDHIGAVAMDVVGKTLVGVNWGSAGFHAWPLDPTGRPTRGGGKAISNGAQYIGYQDCHGAGPRRMLCSGVAGYRSRRDVPPTAIGGVELIDLRDFRQMWQAPVQAWNAAGQAMTSNAAFFEPTPEGVRGYFLPEDGRGNLYVYEAAAAR
ncbi:MAG: SMP-30/gluconolactonase/LRE family protein [Alphaproteobacteria bacterium]|nr:SMP-30/gluconolactonase/LRE family protein [Alphaproteobacteria bacterium]MBU1513135.1 SMP-30/gluconolactonase/LRE family protein [Alphaproteobacteria bacterium]MBU2095243.1 SMP-30/gluconolactonase/LRE family protein [Alphaproteobacteria bacterium]MBU2152159.1 SMP-30/gluconolactonase/LRE family protein [Alphaproteobacteria bacterium]MBU2306795.1 SMP-30/gluconolactonase/LRE family protein [Alphaproteobacteria bacterium]